MSEILRNFKGKKIEKYSTFLRHFAKCISGAEKIQILSKVYTW